MNEAYRQKKYQDQLTPFRRPISYVYNLCKFIAALPQYYTWYLYEIRARRERSGGGTNNIITRTRISRDREEITLDQRVIIPITRIPLKLTDNRLHAVRKIRAHPGMTCIVHKQQYYPRTCPVTTDLIMRVNVRTTTTTIYQSVLQVRYIQYTSIPLPDTGNP